MINNSELSIVSVETSGLHSGIPLKKWENVEEALTIFGSGNCETSWATQDTAIKDIEQQAGALGVAMYALAFVDVDKDKYTKDMLSEAKLAFRKRNTSWRSNPLSGMGTPFFKVSTTITRLPDIQEGYLLELNSDPMGKEIEAGLARKLGIEQGLPYKSVKVELEPEEPEEDDFRIDFDIVAKKLAPFYGELGGRLYEEPMTLRQRLIERIRGNDPLENEDIAFTGETMLRTLCSPNRFILGPKDGIKVNLCVLGAARFEMVDKKEVELRKVKGAILTGSRYKTIKGEIDPSVRPRLEFSIKRHHPKVGDFDTIPAIDPGMKANMNDLAQRIASAFQP